MDQQRGGIWDAADCAPVLIDDHDRVPDLVFERDRRLAAGLPDVAPVERSQMHAWEDDGFERALLAGRDAVLAEAGLEGWRNQLATVSRR